MFPSSEPRGAHLIAGDWVSGTTRFASDPASGPAHDYALGGAAEIDVHARVPQTPRAAGCSCGALSKYCQSCTNPDDQ